MTRNLTFVLGEPATYGGDRVIARYAREMADRGMNVRFLVLGQVRDWRFYEGFSPTVLGIEAFPKSRIDYLRAAARALPHLRGSDVVIATWTPTLPVAALAANFWGAELVWMQQDYPLMFEGLAVETELLGSGARWTDATIAVSDFCADIARSGSPGANIAVVHSGIHEVMTDPIDPPPEREGILFVGGPIHRKGWDTFMDAVVRLRQRDPSLKVRHLGPPADPIPPGQAEPGQIENLGGLNDREVAHLYASTRVYVCASRAEGWGLPALEAMAQGCAVVSTLHDGCRAYARDGENLLLVPPGDAPALANAIDRLLVDLDLVDQLRRGGLETVQSFNWPAAADRFHEILNPSGGGR